MIKLTIIQKEIGEEAVELNTRGVLQVPNVGESLMLGDVVYNIHRRLWIFDNEQRCHIFVTYSPVNDE